MRTPNDAEYLVQRVQSDPRNAWEAVIRDCSETILVQDDLASRLRTRHLAAMRPPSIMH